MNSKRKTLATSRSDLLGVLSWFGVIGVSFALLAGLMTWAAGSLPLGSPLEAATTEEGAGPVVDFQLASLDGGRLGPPDFRGQLVVIDFWATWCGPCRLQAKHLERLHPEFSGKGVQFLAVSLGEPAETVRSFVEKTPFPYPVLIDPDDTVTRRFQIYSLPTVMVLDRAGRIVYHEPGVTDEAQLRQILNQAGAAS